VLRIWNSLPEDVVSADHLSLFISRLERVNLNPFPIGKMEMLLCVLFLYIWMYITNCIFVFSIFYLAAFKRHYAIRLVIAPEFFYCYYMCLFYVCALDCLNKICMYVCMMFTKFAGSVKLWL